MTSHSNRGMSLEKMIEELFKHYEQKGIFCHKLIVKEVNGIKVEKSPFDFIVYYNGILYAFDTKNCESKSISVNNFKLHQIKALTDVNNQKGDAFFLVYFNSISQLEKIPVQEVKDLISSGHRSISPDERRKVKLDFLGVL